VRRHADRRHHAETKEKRARPRQLARAGNAVLGLHYPQLAGIIIGAEQCAERVLGLETDLGDDVLAQGDHNFAILGDGDAR
jgi:hypothetical protein